VSSSPRTIWKSHERAGVSTTGPRRDLKTLAARKQDVEDIRFLIGKLRLSSASDVLAICAEVFPGEPVPARARLLLEDLFAPDDGSQAPVDPAAERRPESGRRSGTH